MTRSAAMLVILALASAGCSKVVEQRVETGLTEAGVPAPLATCMAAAWADELSVDQIREIARLAQTVREERETLTVPRLIEHAASWNDPAALAVITRSAARCAFR